MASVYRRKYKELKSLDSKLGCDAHTDEVALVMCVDDGKKYVAKRVSLKRSGEKDRRAALLEVRRMQATVLRKLRQPNFVGYHESFADETEVIIILDHYDDQSDSLPPTIRPEPLSPNESSSTVEELKSEVETLYQQKKDQEATLKQLQEECRSVKEKLVYALRDAAKAREEKTEWERRYREIGESLERGLAEWVRDFRKGFTGSMRASVSPSHRTLPQSMKRPVRSASRHSSLPSATIPYVNTSLQLATSPKEALDSVQNVREKLTSLQRSKATIESQLQQMRLDLDKEASLSSLEV